MRTIHRNARPDHGATLCQCVTEGFFDESFLHACLLNFDVTHARGLFQVSPAAAADFMFYDQLTQF